MAYNQVYDPHNLHYRHSGDYRERGHYTYGLLSWPKAGYFEAFRPDAELLREAMRSPEASNLYTIADQIFGTQKQHKYVGLKHLANLFYERCRLHKQHVHDIDHRHRQAQEKLFGVVINNFPDKAKRQSTLETQLLQLEGQRRDEELAFWKDTADLREKLFEGAAQYRDAKHRYSVFAGVEVEHGRES